MENEGGEVLILNLWQVSAALRTKAGTAWDLAAEIVWCRTDLETLGLQLSWNPIPNTNGHPSPP